MQKVKDRSRELSLLCIIIIVVIVVSSISPQFLTHANIMNILRTSTISGLLALGMTILIITGNIDVSIGPSMMVSGGIVTQYILEVMREPSALGYVLAFGVAIAVGIVIGLINGAFTVYFRLPSIVVTLGMFSLLSGAITIATGARWIVNFPFWFTSMTSVSFLGVFVPIWIYLIIAVIFYLLLNKLPIGRKILAYGGNRVAAVRAGFSEMKITLFAFALMGVTVGIASVLLVSSTALYDPTAGAGYELEVIAIVILGGAALSGGHATIEGTLLAALLIGIINNAIVLAGVPVFFQTFVVGSMILISVILTALQNHKMKTRNNDKHPEKLIGEER